MSKRFALIVAATVLVLAACGGSSTKTASSSSSATTTTATTAPPTTQSEAEAIAEITKAYTTFFDGTITDLAVKEALVQDIAKLKTVFEGVAAKNAALLKQTSVTVTKVVLTSPTAANVTFTINLNGKPALPDFAGSAVREGGKWLISRAAVCDVSFIGATQPPECTS